MITYAYDLHPRDDPKNGARIVRFTKRQAAQWLRERQGTGSGRMVIRGSDPQAQLLDPRGLQYMRVRRIHDTIVDAGTLSGFAEKTVFGFFTDAFDYEALNKKRTQQLTVGGAGALSVLDREVLWSHTYVGAAGALSALSGGQDPFDDRWRLYAQGLNLGPTAGMLGAVFWRAMAEGLSWQAGPYTHRHADGTTHTDTHADDKLETAIPMVTLTFDAFTDSSGNPWTVPAGSFDARVKESLLSVAKRAMEAGLYIEIDYDTFELRAWERANHGRDMTGAAWGADVVRFQVSDNATVARGNIKSDAKRAIAASVKRSQILAGGHDVYATATDPAATIPWHGGFDSEAEDVDALEAVAATQIQARSDAGDTVRLRFKLGDDRANGKYLPAESGGVLEDDAITLHSGATTWDWDELTMPVNSLMAIQRKNGGWDAFADLGSVYASMESRQFQASSGVVRPSGPTLRLCDPARACEDLTASDLTAAPATNGDAEDTGGTQWSGGAYSTAEHHDGTHSYKVAGQAVGSAIYTFDSVQEFVDGVRHITDVWLRYMGDHLSTELRFGVPGVDEAVATFEGVVGDDPSPGAFLASENGFVKARVCWTPSATRTGAKVTIIGTQAAADDFYVDTLSHYTTTNSELAGSSKRASRCNHGHRHNDLAARNAADSHTAAAIKVVDEAGNYEEDNAEGVFAEIKALIDAVTGVDLSDATPLVESGAGTAGISEEVSRADHVHPAAASGDSGSACPALAVQDAVIPLEPVGSDDDADVWLYLDDCTGGATDGGGDGVTDHGALTGLADFDHDQYVRGLAGRKYYMLAGIVRKSGGSWQFIDDSAHRPLGFASIGADASKISLTPSLAWSRVSSAVAVVDETWVQTYRVGVRVASGNVELWLTDLSGTPVNPGSVANDSFANIWVIAIMEV